MLALRLYQHMSITESISTPPLTTEDASLVVRTRPYNLFIHILVQGHVLEIFFNYRPNGNIYYNNGGRVFCGKDVSSHTDPLSSYHKVMLIHPNQQFQQQFLYKSRRTRLRPKIGKNPNSILITFPNLGSIT